MFFKIRALKNFANFTGKHLCWSLSLNIVAGQRTYNFIKKETPTKVFSCEICEIFRNTFFTENLQQMLLKKILLSRSKTKVNKYHNKLDNYEV